MFAGQLSASQNPHIRVYLDAGPPNLISEIHPLPGTTFDVYVCFDCLGRCGGVMRAGFLLDRTFSGLKTAQVNLLGGPDFGDAEVDGWTITSGPDCAYPADDVVLAARLTYLYLAEPGNLDVLPHPESGRHVEDCESNEDDEYCFLVGLGVCTAPHFGQDYCDCNLPPYWRVARCEPQGGGNPVHPPTYWYDVDNAYDAVAYGFHVRVFDPDITDYSAFSVPSGWIGPETVSQVGNELWLSWCNPELDSPLVCSDFRFEFSNANPSTWGHWTLTGPSDPCHPRSAVVAASWFNYDLPDGWGYRVHVPASSSPAVGTSWGSVKALYRPQGP